MMKFALLWSRLFACRHYRAMESVDRTGGWWLMECRKCGHLERWKVEAA